MMVFSVTSPHPHCRTSCTERPLTQLRGHPSLPRRRTVEGRSLRGEARAAGHGEESRKPAVVSSPFASTSTTRASVQGEGVRCRMARISPEPSWPDRPARVLRGGRHPCPQPGDGRVGPQELARREARERGDGPGALHAILDGRHRSDDHGDPTGDDHPPRRLAVRILATPFEVLSEVLVAGQDLLRGTRPRRSPRRRSRGACPSARRRPPARGRGARRARRWPRRRSRSTPRARRPRCTRPRSRPGPSPRRPRSSASRRPAPPARHTGTRPAGAPRRPRARRPGRPDRRRARVAPASRGRRSTPGAARPAPWGRWGKQNPLRHRLRLRRPAQLGAVGRDGARGLGALAGDVERGLSLRARREGECCLLALGRIAAREPARRGVAFPVEAPRALLVEREGDPRPFPDTSMPPPATS